MKKIILFVLALIMLVSSVVCGSGCGNRPDDDSKTNQYVETNHYIVKDGTTDYKIVIPASAGYYEQLAADELQILLKEALDVELDVVYDRGLEYTPLVKYISIGENDLANQAGVKSDYNTLGNSGYIIKTVGKTVFLIGGSSNGSLYAVYNFLKLLLNYECYAIDEYTIDKSDSLKLYDFDYSERPDTDYREVQQAKMLWHSGDLYNRFYMNKVYILPAYGAHSSFLYFPPEIYMSEHPEWYTGPGKMTDQMCFSQPELVDLLTEKFIENLIDNPEKDCNGANSLMFGIEDNTNWCKCAVCNATKAKYGANSATMILFINKVAKKVQAWVDENQPGRDVKITVMAYYCTIEPPVNVNLSTGEVTWADDDIVCEDNVAVSIAPMESSFAYPLNDVEHNQQAYVQLKGWSSICKNINVWSYSANYTHGFVGMNNFNSLQETYRFLVKECNVRFIQDEQIVYAIGSPNFSDFRTYIQSKWLWNVEEDFETMKINFFNNYYKEAAPEMLQYFNEMQMHFQMLEEEYHVNGAIYEDVYKTKYWSMGLLKNWLELLNKALEKFEPIKESDPVLYEQMSERIGLETLTARYLLIDLYGLKAFASKVLEVEKKSFIDDCNRWQVTSPGIGITLDSLKTRWGVI